MIAERAVRADTEFDSLPADLFFWSRKVNSLTGTRP
jgi:hypothetical protein